MTVDEWAALPEDEGGELVDGRLVEEEVPDLTHEIVVRWLVVHLDRWAEAREAQVFGSGAKLAVAEDRGRMPDVTVFFAGRRLPARGVVRVPPDIAVEVVSTAPSDVRRDRVEKLDDYAAFGVRWYWIVDPQIRTFEVWELTDGRYARVGVAATGAVSEIPGCEGLELDLDDL